MEGYIHSIESFGTLDGPGIRLVVFFQGCPMRCVYCHNPDTWNIKASGKIDSDEILKIYEKNKSFYKDGGITATGGEPLLQIDFLTELFEKAKQKSIHTCLDTSGAVFNESKTSIEKFDRLVSSTDLVILDIKHIDPDKHIKITGHKSENIIKFARYLDDKNKDIWIRHVVVPGLTDNEDEIEKLGCFVAALKNAVFVELLPYHSMGVKKYEALGLDYPLKGTEDMDKEKLEPLYAALKRGIKKGKNNTN